MFCLLYSLPLRRHFLSSAKHFCLLWGRAYSQSISVKIPIRYQIILITWQWVIMKVMLPYRSLILLSGKRMSVNKTINNKKTGKLDSPYFPKWRYIPQKPSSLSDELPLREHSSSNLARLFRLNRPLNCPHSFLVAFFSDMLNLNITTHKSSLEKMSSIQSSARSTNGHWN